MRNIINLTDHSIGSSIIRVDDIINNSKENNYKECFIVEDSTMASAPYFFQECEKNNIKPIYGVKINIEQGGSLIFFAKNKEGYEGLSNLVSSLGGFEVGKKRKLDKELIKSFINESGKNIYLIDGYKGSLLDITSTEKNNSLYKEMIPYIKSVDSALSYNVTSSSVYQSIVDKVSDRFKIPKIYSLQSFYKDSGDFIPFFSIYKKAGYFRGKDAQNIDDFFNGGNALNNEFLSKVGSNTITDESFSDSFNSYSISSDIDFLEISKRGGLRERVRELWLEKRSRVERTKIKKYEDRIKKELETIESLDPVFEQYFMFFDQLSKKAKEKNIKNAIRGSAVGSYVLHLMGLSTVDPVENDLSFERFIFKGIEEYPDIDMDVSNKDEMLKYLSDEYGDNMAQISVFSSVKKVTEAVSLIVDAEKSKLSSSKFRVVMSGEDLDSVMDKVKDLSKKLYGNKNNTASYLIENNRDWKKEYETNESFKKIIDKAIKIEGVFKNRSNSPSSSIVSKEKIKSKIPVVGGVAEVTSEHCEYLGFLKIDILSSKMLNRINKTESKIDWSESGFVGDYDSIDEFISDEKNTGQIYKYISAGMTSGVNQIGGDIGKYICKEVKPESFSDLMVILGLIRMGIHENMKEKPVEFTKFVEGKSNPNSISYIHDDLKPILKETYGSIIYEEQIMEIAKKIGSFNNNEANKFRKCITKSKNEELLKDFRKIFFERAEKNGYSFDVIKDIFDSLQDKMNQFNFSKNHSASYAMISLKEMFLKIRYPSEFISVYDDGNEKNRKSIVEEYEKMGYLFVRPSINSIDKDVKTEDKYSKGKKVRVINLSIMSVFEKEDNFLAVKKELSNGEFRGIVDYVDRVLPYYVSNGSPMMASNKEIELFRDDLNRLIKSGAFDALYDRVLSESVEFDDTNRFGRAMVLRRSLSDSVDKIIDAYTNIDGENSLEIEFDKKFKNESVYELIADERDVLGFSPTDSVLKKISGRGKKRHP